MGGEKERRRRSRLLHQPWSWMAFSFSLSWKAFWRYRPLFPFPPSPTFPISSPPRILVPPPLLSSRRGRYACLCDERSFAADRSGGRGKLCARATHKIGARGGVSRTREYREGGPVASEEIDFDTLFGCVRRHRVGRKGLSSNDFFTSAAN